MIVPSIENPVMVDIGRPNIVDESSYKYWTNIHKFIRESPLSVMVNSAFNWVDSGLKNPDFRYLGGGFHYCFWFETEEGIHALREFMKKEA